MRRDLRGLTDAPHDLLVVGAGIHGAWIAWDARLRGLRVAVVDRGDFGAATSASSLRIVHGGLRYLARGDLPRMRESVQERSALLRVAPHLVRPLPVLVPTYGAGLQGRLALGAALAVNDLLTLTRNRGLRPDRTLPRGRLVSREECRRLFPAVGEAGLTGGALWYDARLLHPERLTLGLVLAAGGRGAAAANYVRVDRLLVEAGAVVGVRATDLLEGREIEIRARAVVLAAGPWTDRLVDGHGSAPPAEPPPGQAFAMNLVLRPQLAGVAVGVRTRTGPEADPVCGGRRYIFLVPNGEGTLLGTWYAVPTPADVATLAERGCEALLAELGEACPGLRLRREDVVGYQWGWLPLKAELEAGRPHALAERPRIIDHGARGGPRGLLSVVGVKLTTARGVAERAVDRVCTVLRIAPAPCRTAQIPLDPPPAPPDFETAVRRAVREEMAVRLADVVLRRLGLGADRRLPRGEVEAAARIAAEELGWSPPYREAEIADVMRQTRAVEREAGVTE